MHNQSCSTVNCRECQAEAQTRVSAKRAQCMRLATLEALAQGISDADLTRIREAYPNTLSEAVKRYWMRANQQRCRP